MNKTNECGCGSCSICYDFEMKPLLEARETIHRVRQLHKPVASYEYQKINGNLERVEVLGCIECEETGSGREYLVKYPCPTIKALGEE